MIKAREIVTPKVTSSDTLGQPIMRALAELRAKSPSSKEMAVTNVTSVTNVTHCASCGQRLPTKTSAKQRAYRARKKARQ